MKRYIAVLIAVLFVPLLSIQAFAEDLYLPSVVPSEKLPAGYITNIFPSYVPLGRNAIVFYNFVDTSYYYITYTGLCTLLDSSGRFRLYFSNPSSVEMRLYKCDGRDVFTVTPENKMKIEFPAQDLCDISFNNFSVDQHSDGYRLNIRNYGELQGSWVDESFIIYDRTGVNITNRGDTWYPDYYIDFPSINQTMNISGLEAHAVLNKIQGTITQEEFAQSHFDYYVVQRSGSSVKTPIDYQETWDQATYVTLTNYSAALNGYLVSAYIRGDSRGSLEYANGAYYTGWSEGLSVTLRGSDLLTGWYSGVSVDVYNRYITHFGYESIFYSEQGTQISSDISGIGGTVGGWSSQAEGYASQSSSAITDIQSSLLQAKPLFTSVWNILPSWFIALIAVVLVIVIGRKVLGR